MYFQSYLKINLESNLLEQHPVDHVGVFFINRKYQAWGDGSGTKSACCAIMSL